MIEERDMQEPKNVAFHVVYNWRYIAKLTLIEDLYDQGYQLADSQSGNQYDKSIITDSLSAAPTLGDDRFDLDIYFILVRFLVDAEKMKMHNLKIWPLAPCSMDI